MGMIKKYTPHARHLSCLARGGLTYLRTGVTPEEAYQSLIQLHCMTNGHSQEAFHQLVRCFRRRYSIKGAHGVLGTLSDRKAKDYSRQLKDQGYVVFPQRLSEEICDHLMNHALTHEAMLTPSRDGQPKRAVYNREQPLAEGYKFEEPITLMSPQVQSLMADSSILSVAQAYLGCRPVLGSVGFWWSNACKFSNRAQTRLAQQYHFDMDNIKWIKFFAYLTDVDAENGPHCFVAKSHRAGNQPKELRARGYARIPDEEIRKHYPKDAFIELTGQRGTIIAVDTRGYHKGKPLQERDRLILELNFADCLFGTSATPSTIAEPVHPDLALARKLYPSVFQRINFAPGPHQQVTKAA